VIEITVLETTPKTAITIPEEQATRTTEEVQIMTAVEEYRRALHLAEEVRTNTIRTDPLLKPE
jgi:hypothetical protein